MIAELIIDVLSLCLILLALSIVILLMNVLVVVITICKKEKIAVLGTLIMSV